MTGAGPGLEKLKKSRAGARPGSEFFLPGPGRDLKNFIAGAGIYFIAGAEAGPGSEFFFIAGPGRYLNFFYCRGRDLFYCRGRAGIKISLMLGPGQNWNIFYCRGRAGISIFLLPGPGRD